MLHSLLRHGVQVSKAGRGGFVAEQGMSRGCDTLPLTPQVSLYIMLAVHGLACVGVQVVLLLARRFYILRVFQR